MKSGRQYADDVRELRAQGLNFPASRGYLLRSPAQWSSGQKAAVTRAINQFDFSAFDAEQEALAAKKPKRKPPRKRPAPHVEPQALPDAGGLAESDIEVFWDAGYGDNEEEWDDMFYFDESEADDLMDEEADDYEEDT